MSEKTMPANCAPYRDEHQKMIYPVPLRIPWAMIAPHEPTALRNHAQSLERLLERGGLSACEALAILEDRPWHAMDIQAAQTALSASICAWLTAALASVKTMGQVAYEAYCTHTGWKSLATGSPLPPWEHVKPEMHEAWEAAALAATGMLRECNEALVARERMLRSELNNLRMR
jgi:hypothetical protein